MKTLTVQEGGRSYTVRLPDNPPARATVRRDVHAGRNRARYCWWARAVRDDGAKCKLRVTVTRYED